MAGANHESKGLTFAIRPDIEVSVPSNQGFTRYRVDHIVYDDWPGMKDYLTRGAFEWKTGDGPEQTEGHDIIRECIIDITGGSRYPQIREELDRIALSRKIALLRGHAGDFGGVWGAADHPVIPQIVADVHTLLEALKGHNYGAVVLSMCNPGNHDIHSSPIPTFYIHGVTKLDPRRPSIPKVFRP